MNTDNSLSRADAVTAFTDQPIALRCGPYICGPQGVAFRDRSGRLTAVTTQQIMPVRRIKDAESGAQRLELAFLFRGVWERVTVLKSAVANAASLVLTADRGVNVCSANARALSAYLMHMDHINGDLLPETVSVSHLGWVKDLGFVPYAPGVSYNEEAGCGHLLPAIGKAGCFEQWLEAAKRLREESVTARVVLAASFASVLLEPLGVLPFFLHLYGESGLGKSVGLMTAASVWGKPEPGAFISNFDATRAGQEAMAGFLHNLPLCIDELQILESAGERGYDNLVYRLTEKSGRLRSKAGGGLRVTETWHNCMITTGERPISGPASMGGALNRLLEAELTAPLCGDLPALARAVSANYGHAGPAFIELLQKAGFETVRGEYNAYFERLLKAGVSGKRLSCGAALLTADAVTTNVLYRQTACLGEEDLLPLLSAPESGNIHERTLEMLRELPGRYPNRFETNAFNSWTGERWGTVRGGYIYILRGAFNDVLQNAGENPRPFLDWANREGLLLTDKGRRDKVIRSGQRTEHFIVLRES